MSDLKGTRSDHVAFRLGKAAQMRVEALKPHISKPWHEATGSDALRALILLGLEVAEKEPHRLRGYSGPKPNA